MFTPQPSPGKSKTTGHLLPDFFPTAMTVGYPHDATAWMYVQNVGTRNDIALIVIRKTVALFAASTSPCDAIGLNRFLMFAMLVLNDVNATRTGISIVPDMLMTFQTKDIQKADKVYGFLLRN
jgi:hypothetical protein